MEFKIIGLLFASILVVSAEVDIARAAPQDDPPRIGEIKIYGNTVTRDQVILDALNVFTGQVLRMNDIRAAEKGLKELGIFRANGCRVEIENPERTEPFKNILVRVEETNTTRVRLMPTFSANGGLAIGLVLEERNFDLFQLPRNMEDLNEGRVLRGAGKTLRVELLQFGLSSGLPVIDLSLGMRNDWRALISNWCSKMMSAPSKNGQSTK